MSPYYFLSLTMFISSCFNNYPILNFENSEFKKKKLRLQWDSNPQSLGFEATEHLRNGMRKEKCRIRL